MAAAKARFAACLRAAESGEIVVITKHGRQIAALVPASDIEPLRRLRAAGPEGGLASLAGGWKGSDDLVRDIANLKRSRARPTPEPD